MNLQNRIADLRILLKQKKYEQVLLSLTESIIDENKSVDLYLIQAEAFYRLNKFEEFGLAADSALLIDGSNTMALYFKGNSLWKLNKSVTSINYYLNALKIDPKFALAYHGLGLTYFAQNLLEKAEDSFKKAIEINPALSLAYEGLGHVHKANSQTQKAIEAFKTALSIDPNSGRSNFNLGNIYFELGNHQEAIVSYTEQFKISPDLTVLLYNRGMAFKNSGNFKKALEDLEAFLKVYSNDKAYQWSNAKSVIEEMHKLIAISYYDEIAELVHSIKRLLLYQEECITHYTSLSVAEHLILDQSLLRLSEGAFLNDTSEGKELFKHLPSLDTLVIDLETDTIAQVFTQKPFIGSYVAENKHDDLTMWRMYGKENMIEAKGCAITLYRESFLGNIIERLESYPDTTNKIFDSAAVTNKDEFEFYRVAYRTAGKNFEVPGAQIETQNELNTHMDQLCKILLKFNSSKTNILSDVQNVKELLNEIAFLFKSGEYQYEHEIRLVLKGTGFKKSVVNKNDVQRIIPPRVYIELIDINPVIKQITLGPKVENAEEWAASFYYSLTARDFYPNIFISHLPFK